jgi:two-component system sensor histidine kinase UhpB
MVRVTVGQDPGRILLVIQDDGKGFDAGLERGMGLLGMQERVSHLGGTFSVESQPGQGAILCVVLPLNQNGQRSSGTAI